MFWTQTNYPNEMNHLEENIRKKAIDLANSLYRDGYDQSRSIAIAICQAKVWYAKKYIDKSIEKT